MGKKKGEHLWNVQLIKRSGDPRYCPASETMDTKGKYRMSVKFRDCRKTHECLKDTGECTSDLGWTSERRGSSKGAEVYGVCLADRTLSPRTHKRQNVLIGSIESFKRVDFQ